MTSYDKDITSRDATYVALKHMKSLSCDDKNAIAALIRTTALAARRNELYLVEIALLRGDLSIEKIAICLGERASELRRTGGAS